MVLVMCARGVTLSIGYVASTCHGHSNGPIRIWDVVTGTHARDIVLDDHVRVACPANDGRVFTLSPWYQKVGCFDTETNTVVHSWQAIELPQPENKWNNQNAACQLVLNPDQSCIFTSRKDFVYCLDARTGGLLQLFHLRSGPDAVVDRFCLSDDGTLLCVALTTHHDSDERFALILFDVASADVLTQLSLSSAHGVGVLTLAASPTQRYQFFGGRRNGHAFCYDLTPDRPATRLASFASGAPTNVYCVAVSSDGRHLYTASHFHVRRWDVATAALEQTFSPDHKSLVRTLMLTCSDELLVTSGNHATIHIWRARTGELLHSIPNAADSSVVNLAPV